MTLKVNDERSETVSEPIGLDEGGFDKLNVADLPNIDASLIHPIDIESLIGVNDPRL